MKVTKTASGKKRIKISKKEWQSIGKKAGWMKVAEIEELYEQYDMARSDKPIYVSLYETSRNYGGPEEGGWWYTDYSLQSSKIFYDREEAEKFADALRNGVEAKGLNDESLSSARGMDQYEDPSGGDPMYDHSDADIPLGFSGAAKNYTVIVEDQSGSSATRERPHYE